MGTLWKRRRFRSLALAALLLLALLAQQALASGFSVAPVRLDFEATGEIATIRVRNEAPMDTVVQIDPLHWSADAKGDVLEASEDLLVSPPLFRLPAGETQLVRVALLSAPDALRERSYRLLLREVPEHRTGESGQLQVALQISMPVFVAPRAPADAELAWEARRGEHGELELEAVNTGNAHTRLTAIEVAEASPDAMPIETRRPAYLLPGQRRQWTLPAQTLNAEAGDELRIKARSANDAVFDAMVRLPSEPGRPAPIALERPE